jgi:hypothetical protein
MGSLKKELIVKTRQCKARGFLIGSLTSAIALVRFSRCSQLENSNHKMFLLLRGGAERAIAGCRQYNRPLILTKPAETRRQLEQLLPWRKKCSVDFFGHFLLLNAVRGKVGPRKNWSAIFELAKTCFFLKLSPIFVGHCWRSPSTASILHNVWTGWCA